MILLAGIVLRAMLIAAPQKPIIEFRVSNAYVTYEAHETNLGSELKTVIGRNKDLSIELLASPENVAAKLLISSSGFKTDRPMRDWSVKTLYLKSGTYPEITFDILKIDGELLSKVLHPVNKSLVIKTALKNMIVDIIVPNKENTPLLLQAGGEKLLVEGKLRDDILNAINSDKGKIHLTGRLTVAGGSKDFDTAVSFNKIGDNKFAISTLIDAKFTDFGMSAPNLAWFIAVRNRLILNGYGVVEVLK